MLISTQTKNPGPGGHLLGGALSVWAEARAGASARDRRAAPRVLESDRERLSPKVGDGEGKRVRSVELGRDVETEHDAHDLSDLALVGPPVACDGALHACGRVLGDGNPRSRQAQEHDAASVTELCRRLRVLVKKQRFDRSRVGAEAPNHGCEANLEHRQTL